MIGMDEVDEELHVVPLPTVQVYGHTLPAPGTATIEQARGSSVVHGKKVRCTATSKWTGEQCRQWAVNGATICYVHGAAEGTPARAKASERILAEYEEWLEDATRKAMVGVSDILENPEDQKVLLSAAKDVLDRAGHGAVKKSMSINVDMDVDAEIEGLLARGSAPKDEGVLDV